jgi:hypothetical protein
MAWQAIATGLAARLARKAALWWHRTVAHRWAEKWRSELKAKREGRK